MKPRIGRAVVFAPLALGLAFAIPGFVSGPGECVFGVVVALFAYAGMVFVGLPALLVLNRYGATRWWQVTLAGFPVPAILVGPSNMAGAVSLGLCGAFVALAAWFVAYYILDPAPKE